MIRRLIGTLVLVAVIGIAVNDLWRISAGVKHLRSVTYDVTRWAAENAQDMPRDRAAASVQAEAKSQGVTLYAYDQTDKAVRVYTSVEVPGTIIAGPLYNMAEGDPLGEAWTTPLVIREHRDAGFAR